MAACKCVVVLFGLCPGSNVGLNFQIWNLAAAVTGALLVDKLGRRTLFLISNTGMLLGHYFRVSATAIY